MSKHIALIIIVIMSAVLAGCGSTSRVTRDLLISSDPVGAVVYMDGDKIGVTPLKLQTYFTWNSDKPYNSLLRRVVQVRKEGFTAQTRDLYPIDMPNIMFFLSPEIASGDAKGGTK